MTANDFASLGLSEPLLRALVARKYTTPTPIQARSIPHLLQGRDLLGIAQTGTGKTAAFALPMLQLLTKSNHRPMSRMPRALVLAPTRELATQIADSFEAYGRHLNLSVTIVFGGVGQNPQVQALKRGIDILVATPGRLLDLIKQRHCDLGEVEILVLDEADRMLDMGFLPDVRRILSTLPPKRHSLLFSATMPGDITSLANKLLHDPLRVEVTPPAATADRIAQSIYFVSKAGKRDLLANLLADPVFERTLVFTRTKHGADRVVKHLKQEGIHSHAIHGNKSQNARERALDDFRSGKAPVLIATDIAARGIDVPEISHVINFDLPNIPESYVHRIGRTARAGRDGIAISFCDPEEREFLRDIEKLIKQRIPVVSSRTVAPAQRQEAPAKPKIVAGNPWHEQEASAEAVATAESDEPRGPRQRNRPEGRKAPGPYEPSPENKRPAPAPRSLQGERKRHQHRPATPNYVDPEQRRHVPKQPDTVWDEPGDDRAPRPSAPQRPPVQHRGPAPQRGPSQHRGPAPRSHGGGGGHRGGSGGGGGGYRGGSGGQRSGGGGSGGERRPGQRPSRGPKL
jgi:ATP-dependent RNA helicase RhlE